ncbi:FAD-dependent oxidoreductase [Biformimicrobium ophioploci]|uniref:FAD-dependent oxidoreductase n=1 Tax=Biformimicrobium ophioploci TaxID=3036711 RepID=A0ABQ6LZ10_9GAMM|nr:FAD-dependent oxidoreductase [Microbulbifer sp. NKW57]GMG87304.1 FAD-dependent oxidoreductase [Microbulbifer sp. NKW57]
MPTDFDVVVIGAGIQGAGVASAASAAGARVLVLEQTGVGSGTSSRSSKLIHGGLRYLESRQFRLVHECLRERHWLLQNKPELVRLVPFYIPVYRHSRRSPWLVRLGLVLYSMLTGARIRSWRDAWKGARFRQVPRSQWHLLAGIEQRDLRAVFQYYDAQTDDKALTRAVIDDSLTHGATLLCPASLIGAELVGNRVRVDYFDNGALKTARCKVLVNCAGPWVENVNSLCTPALKLPPLELVAGTHILLPVSLGERIFYIEAEDGRAIFVMPWKGRTLVGTTERSYAGSPESVMPTVEEELYLLHAVQRHFPETGKLQLQDLQNSYAGLRVLPKSADLPFSRPRETLIATDDPRKPRMVAVAGGKLTSYRATAAKVLSMIRPSLQPEPTESTTIAAGVEGEPPLPEGEDQSASGT